MSNFKSKITNLKIILAITFSLAITIILSKLFIAHSLQPNQPLISSLPEKTSRFLSQIFPKKPPPPNYQLPLNQNKFGSGQTINNDNHKSKHNKEVLQISLLYYILNQRGSLKLALGVSSKVV